MSSETPTIPTANPATTAVVPTPPPEITTSAVLAALGPLQAIFGDPLALSRSTVAFSTVHTAPVGKLFNSSWFDSLGLKSYTDGRQSAVVDLNNVFAQVAPVYATSLTVVHYTVGICFIPKGRTVPDTLGKLMTVPGHLIVTGSIATSQVGGKVGFPPGIYNDAIIKPVIGDPPQLVIITTGAGITDVIVSLSSTVSLRGIGYVTAFR